jgi:hypothetical protein
MSAGVFFPEPDAFEILILRVVAFENVSSWKDLLKNEK